MRVGPGRMRSLLGEPWNCCGGREAATVESEKLGRSAAGAVMGGGGRWTRPAEEERPAEEVPVG